MWLIVMTRRAANMNRGARVIPTRVIPTRAVPTRAIPTRAIPTCAIPTGVHGLP